MLNRWTGKQLLRLFGCFAAFFLLVLLTQLPGYMSPFYWTICPLLSAFAAAGSITCVMDMKRGFGSAAVLPLLWFILYRCIGEMGMPLMWIWVIAVIVIAEIVHKLMRYGTLKSIRVCAPLASLATFGMLIPLYFQKNAFLARAASEMDPTYVAGLDRYGTLWIFALVLALAVGLAVLSERLTEKILKIEK